MAIKFSQFNLRTNSTPTMFLVGYDGNQNIHITVDNLINDFINGTENTIAMFGPGGNNVIDSAIAQQTIIGGDKLLTVQGFLNVDEDVTIDRDLEVTRNTTLNGNVILGNASADLITQTGTLYLNGPVKDTTDTLGDTDKILVSDAAGELTFQKLSETHVKSSEIIVQNIKANEALTKGDPVYIVGFQVGRGVNIVAKADASNPAKMPATGIIDEDYSAQAFGTMTAFGSFNTNFDASGGTENWQIGDILYVKSGGGLTNIKPTGSDLIQNIAIVSRNHQQTGELEVVALGRTNDIPNLTPGKIWVGSTGNTIESSSITFTEATGAVQLNEYGTGTITGTATYNLSVDASGNVIETTAVPANIVETLTAASGTYISLTDATSATGDVDLGTFDLNAADGVAVANERYLTKSNTWAEVATIPGTYTFDISDGTTTDTISSGDTVQFVGNNGITTFVNPTPLGPDYVRIEHDSTGRTDTTSAQSPGYGGTFTAVDSISTNTQGHLTAVNLKTVTMPSADDTNTTYDLEGVGSANGTAGVRLAGSDATNDDVLIVGAGTAGVVRVGNTLTVTSNDQYTGTVTSVDTSAPLTGGTITTTGTIGITQATTSTDGYLSSTDWNTFNNKQDTITNPVTGTGVATRVAFWNGTSSLSSNADLYWDNTNNRLGIGTTIPDTILHLSGDSPTIKLEDNVAVSYYNPKIEFYGPAEAGTLEYLSNPVFSGMRLHYRNSFLNDDTFLNLKNGLCELQSVGYTGGVTLKTDGVLQVNGSNNSYFSNGNVGIGTTSPGSKLEVAGDASSALLTLKSLNGGSNDSFMRFYDESNGPSYSVGLDSSDQKFKIAYDTDGDSLTTGTKLVMDTSGSVGIGTTFPSAKLDVAGNTTGTLLTLKSLNGGVNDAAMRFYDESNGPAYVMGLDSSDEKFKIAFDYDNNSVSSGTKLTINTSGNVGIGTISPSQKLEVAGNIKMTETAAATDTDKFVVLDSGVLKYRTGTQVRSDIGAGNISTSGFTMNDAAQIKTYQSINSGSSQSAATLITENDISFGGCINWWSEVQNGSFGTFNHAVFYHGTTFAGAIRRSGNTTVSYITSSDYRLKENVIEITDGIERVKQLKPSKFNFIGEDRIVDGFLAHEVQDVVPESISGEKDEEDDDGNPIYQGIDQSKMVPLLTAALQEAIAKIESLESRIQTLENQ